MRHRAYAVMFAVVMACDYAALPKLGGDGGGSGGDADTQTGDSASTDSFSGTCSPSANQCADCVDNDGDGRIDGYDPECTQSNDLDEGAFATGIPGDNIDATQQDCFFDGNSGSGNDGCQQHVCCLLGAMTTTQCAALAPAGTNSGTYNKANCYAPFGTVTVPQGCINVCTPVTVPSCDCFGCCRICDDATGVCKSVVLNPAISPSCNDANFNDIGPDGTDNTGDEPCRRCVASTCGRATCGGTSCVLCLGQTAGSLPANCSGIAACPSGTVACTAGACAAGAYCANGCCISSQP